MRLIIDLQGAQTESRFRGIGRYSLSLSLAIAKNYINDEIFIVLNGLFPETIRPIRDVFKGVLPQKNILVWHGFGPVNFANPINANRRQIAENTKEAFIANLQPDVVLITSLFEGLGDDAVTSVKRFDKSTPVAAILYDLIPLINPDINFKTNPVYIEYYSKKIESLKNCTALLAISESSRKEALDALEIKSDKVINIFGGFDSNFKKVEVTKKDKELLFNKFNIKKKFLMYTGGADERKNLNLLIEAYSKISEKLRHKLQLVFVGKMPQSIVESLKIFAKKQGFKDGDLIFTGYVSDSELSHLYGSCELFIFPSLHEGFGLPPLEAMACGAPVICSNATSLPEVMGDALKYALFNPASVDALQMKIEEVLVNRELMQKLIDDGSMRIAEFSWDKVAIEAMDTLRRISRPSSVLNDCEKIKESQTGIYKNQYTRILVSKLDHMGDLVLAIPAILKLKARYPNSKIDALVGSWNIKAAESLKVFDKIFSFDYFSKQSAVSPQLINPMIDSLSASMTNYDWAIDLRRQSDTRQILLKMPAKRYAGYLTGIKEIDCHLSVGLHADQDIPFVITALNKTPISLQMIALIDALPYDVNDYLSFPEWFSKGENKILGSIAIFPKAGNDVKEWSESNYLQLIEYLDAEINVSTISVYLSSSDDASFFIQSKSAKIRIIQGLTYEELLCSLAKHEICVGNNSYGVHLGSLLGLKVVGIYAGHETVEEWAPVFGDCHVISSPVDCSPCHIARREDCSNEFKCISGITPERVRDVIINIIMQREMSPCFLESRFELRKRLIKNIMPLANELNDDEKKRLAFNISQNLPINRKKHLYVDISELVVNDARTGIQRVVRSVLKSFLENSSAELVITPVYAKVDSYGYLAANSYYAKFMGLTDAETTDTLINFQPGDIFLGLDLQPVVVVSQRKFYQEMRDIGVRVIFVVYDILCIQMPQYFDKGLVEMFSRWLEVVSESDGAICISKSVERELKERIGLLSTSLTQSFYTGWFHLGADIETSSPSVGLPEDADLYLDAIGKHPCFLMVGTIEPRKGHQDVLNAFNELWLEGYKVNLVIVGKTGWGVDSLIKNLSENPQLNSHLFLFNGISDEFLEKIYLTVDCLIAASEGEGFGLPLIEAAQIDLPIIARDIPVFREVAGENAFFFNDNERPLNNSIKEWLILFESGHHPRSGTIPRLSWSQSAANLLSQII